MALLDSINWEKIFYPDTPLLEIFVRGSVTYIALFLLLRLVLKRQTGTVSVTDVLVIVLIADAAQNGMADDYQSLADGILLVATLIFWNFIFDLIAFYWKPFRKLTHPSPIPLIKDGKKIRRNMRAELINDAEIESILRENDISDISEVKMACMEGDGQISILTYEEQEKKKQKKKRLPL